MTGMIDKVGGMMLSCISSLSCKFTIESDCDTVMSVQPVAQTFSPFLGGGE